jgi:hypothetical protein
MKTLLKWGFSFLLIPVLSVSIASSQTGYKTLILGDGSGSMQGFAKADANRLSALFQLLFRNSDLPQFGVLTIDKQTQATKVVSVPQSNFFASPANYRGGTNLVYALQNIHQNSYLSMFVTDGMQSEGMYVKVKDKLKQMASEGWGVWLFAIRLPFDGVYDPEQLITFEDARPMIEQCIQKDDPHAQITPRGASSNRLFNYKGLRPLLIFVFAKDAAVGRALAQKISFNLNADPQFPTQEVELSPLVYRGIDFSEAQPISDYIRLENSSDRVVIHSDTVDEQRIKEIVIPVAWMSDLPSIPQAYNEGPQWTPDQVSWIEDEPEIINAEEEPPGKIKVRFISELSWLRSTFCFLPFVSCTSEKSDMLNISIWTDFTKAQPAWWDEMNTDTSWQCPSRVYKLAELTKELGEISIERHKAAHPPKTKALKLIVGPV